MLLCQVHILVETPHIEYDYPWRVEFAPYTLTRCCYPTHCLAEKLSRLLTPLLWNWKYIPSLNCHRLRNVQIKANAFVVGVPSENTKLYTFRYFLTMSGTELLIVNNTSNFYFNHGTCRLALELLSAFPALRFETCSPVADDSR